MRYMSHIFLTKTKFKESKSLGILDYFNSLHRIKTGFIVIC